jgi:hypothetical protein
MGEVAILPHGLPNVGLTGSDAVAFWYGHISPADAAQFMEWSLDALDASHQDGSGPPQIITAGGTRYRRVDLFEYLNQSA